MEFDKSARFPLSTFKLLLKFELDNVDCPDKTFETSFCSSTFFSLSTPLKVFELDRFKFFKLKRFTRNADDLEAFLSAFKLRLFFRSRLLFALYELSVLSSSDDWLACRFSKFFSTKLLRKRIQEAEVT